MEKAGVNNQKNYGDSVSHVRWNESEEESLDWDSDDLDAECIEILYNDKDSKPKHNPGQSVEKDPLPYRQDRRAGSFTLPIYQPRIVYHPYDRPADPPIWYREPSPAPAPQLKPEREKKFVDHLYFDFSRLDDDEITEMTDIEGDKLETIIECKGANRKNDVETAGDYVPNKNAKHSRTRNVLNFPKKLMIMLEDDPNPDVVSWLPHGRCFVIKDSTRFMNEVHPSYFNSALYKTFQRMLNLWGFKRLTVGLDSGAYYHQLFLRGMPNLVRKMILTKKKNGVRPLPNP